MRTWKITMLAFLSSLLLWGCASVAYVERDESVNFNNYHSYAWVDSRESKSDSTSTPVSDLTERRIREAIDAEMAKAGWKTSRTKPDVLLSYDVLVERSVRDDASPLYSQPMTRFIFNPYNRRWVPIYYPSQFVGYDRAPRTVKEGTLTLSIIDAKSDKTIWQGWTTNEVNSQNLTSKEIKEGVRTIFRKFDVAKN